MMCWIFFIVDKVLVVGSDVKFRWYRIGKLLVYSSYIVLLYSNKGEMINLLYMSTLITLYLEHNNLYTALLSHPVPLYFVWVYNILWDKIGKSVIG